MARPKKTKIEAGSKQSLTELMQETYNNANDQINQAQKIVNELSSHESPNDSTDDVAKINKEKVSALKARDSAIRIKTDLARLNSEMIKHDNKEQALDEAEDAQVSDLDFSNLRKELKGSNDEDNEEGENKS